MSRYNQYGSYYDPVGSSSSSQPSGYTYQPSTSAPTFQNAPTSATYNPGYQSYGGNAYGNQQYSSTSGQQTNPSATHAAAALHSMSSQNYSQPASTGRSNTTSQQDTAAWDGAESGSNNYTASNLALPNRSQATNSPLYSSTQTSSNFNPLNQGQRGASSFGSLSTYQPTSSNPTSSDQSYQPAYNQQQTQQPPRYNSPLQAVQAQRHGHNKQPSRGSSHKPSPQITQVAQTGGRQQSASVEPSPTTVDPSQVYDNRAELQRKAQIEAQRRERYEAEQAEREAEEERLEAEKRRVEEEERKQAEEVAAAKKRADLDRRNEQKRKAREDKKASKSAATTLQQMASTGGPGSSEGVEDEEEIQMREMFKKMREFNAKNPAMLAKLWEEERSAHSSQSPQAQAAKAVSPPKQLTQPKAAAQKAATGAGSPPKPTANISVPLSAMAQQKKPISSASSPITTTASTSLWPPHKKGTVAEATTKWLLSMPQNAGKSITFATIFSILDKNPSYVQLCEELEGHGLKFSRSSLARELLKVVPDPVRSQTGAKASTPVLPQASSSFRPPSEARPLSLSAAAMEVNRMDKPSPTHMQPPPPSPSFPLPHHSPSLTNGSRAQSQPHQPEVKQEYKPEEPPRPPADKEEAARKRTFGDLVDLTAGDSDEDDGPPRKILHGAAGPTVALASNETYSPKWRDPPGLSQPQPAVGLKPYTYNPSPSIPSQQQPPPLVPTQPVPPPKPKGPSAEYQQQLRVRGKMLVEPVMRDRVVRKSRYDSKTIARDVLLATGRHPDMRGLNAHLGAMQKLLGQHGGEFDTGGNRSDLSTIRWDIIDPEFVPEPEPAPKQRSDAGGEADGVSGMKSIQTGIVSYEAPSGSINQQSAAPVKHKRGRPPNALRASLPLMTSEPLLTNGLGKASTSTPRQSPRPDTPSTAPAASKPVAHADIARTEIMSSDGPVGYSKFRQLDAEGNVIKKKGRPVGWRKNVHSREAQGLAPITHPTKAKGPAEKGPVAKPKTVPVPPVQEPHYAVYKCEWACCKAELHNLDTLKKHIAKLHADKDEEEGLYLCAWGQCEGEQFEGIEGFMEHVNDQHLQPIAWKLGDGPRSDLSRYNYSSPPAYLLDDRGRSITPIIVPILPAPKQDQPTAGTSTKQGPEKDHQSSPPETSSQPPQQPQLSTAIPAHVGLKRGRPPKDPSGLSKSARDLAAPLRELEAHKLAVGPVMDRMGCVLVDDRNGRRETFLAGEDFEGEVFGSDGEPGDAWD